jgi:genome maintenance exonuclease 1
MPYGHDVADKSTAFACERGSVMHNLIESKLLGNDLSTCVCESEADKVGYGLYKKLLPKINRIQPIGLETVLWSDVLGIAGRCDCIGYYDGVLSIIDYKTSRKSKNKQDIENYWLQTTFYALAFEEQHDVKIDQLVILMAIEDGVNAVFKEPVRSMYVEKLINRINAFYKLQESFHGQKTD